MENDESVELSTSIDIPGEVQTGLVLVQNRLRKLAATEFVTTELHESVMYILKNQGKMIRPGLMFSVAKMLGQNPEKFVDLASAIELLHISSLVHDDILDGDAVRRGQDAVHVKYGQDRAILVGDALIAKAIKMASPYGGDVVSRASDAAMNMCAGELLDYNHQISGASVDLHTYLKIAELKTASLIATSTSIVADYLGDASKDTLYKVGTNMGMSFQIRDDIMNHMGDKTDANNSRPNIVSVFGGHGKPNPMKTAVKLNNFYIDSAALLLDQVKNADVLENYLQFLKIE